MVSGFSNMAILGLLRNTFAKKRPKIPKVCAPFYTIRDRLSRPETPIPHRRGRVPRPETPNSNIVGDDAHIVPKPQFPTVGDGFPVPNFLDNR